MPFDPIITVTLNPAIDRVLEVDGFKIGGHQLGRLRHRVAAGKGINVSKALARLGVPSVATGFLGRDNAQEFEALLLPPDQRDLLTRIKLQFFEIPGATRENVTLIDTTDQAETHVRDQGVAVGEKDLLRLKRKLDLMSRAGALVIFGGGLPPGVEGEQLAQLAHICISAGARVVVDSSASAMAAVSGLPLWMVKPNREELAELVGRPVGEGRPQVLAAGRELASRYEYVLVSLGAEGGLAFHGERAVAGHVPIQSDRVVSSVGCGDCMVAGMVAGINRGEDWEQAYRLALGAATANVIGGAPSEFTDAHLREFTAAAVIEPIV